MERPHRAPPSAPAYPPAHVHTCQLSTQTTNAAALRTCRTRDPYRGSAQKGSWLSIVRGKRANSAPLAGPGSAQKGRRASSQGCAPRLGRAESLDPSSSWRVISPLSRDLSRLQGPVISLPLTSFVCCRSRRARDRHGGRWRHWRRSLWRPRRPRRTCASSSTLSESRSGACGVCVCARRVCASARRAERKQGV